MRAVGITRLKSRLSEYVWLAASGETVLVLDRGQVVAELGLPGRNRARATTDERKADLVRRGVLTPAIIERTGPPPRSPRIPLAEILRGLNRNRADR